MNTQEKIARFRSLHGRDAAFVLPNPWDTGTARILASLGFEALATTSAGSAFALGRKDGQVSREDVLAHCLEIVSATDLPVSADLEKGFGDSPEAVGETIRAAAETGLAGCSIEDYTDTRAGPIFDFELAVERIQAATEAKQKLSDDFVLTARCENLIRGRDDLDDTIQRLRAYESAGADVLYAPGLHDLASIRAVCESVSKPVNVVMGMPGTTFSIDELSAVGVKRISTGSALARAAFGTFVRAANEIKEHGIFEFAADAIGFAEVEAHFDDYEK